MPFESVGVDTGTSSSWLRQPSLLEICRGTHRIYRKMEAGLGRLPRNIRNRNSEQH